MFSNSYLEIGSTHKFCQDYTLHGCVDGRVFYAILADGCSEAPRSEIGAQILCSVAEYYIHFLHHTGALIDCSTKTLKSLFANHILTRADEIRKLYPIDRGALQATLLMAITFERTPGVPITYVFAWGDGYIIEKRDGQSQTVVHEIRFPSGAPVYLVTDPIEYKNKIDIQECEYTRFSVDTKCTSETSKLDLFGGMFMEFLPNDHLSSLTLCSDGLKSFQDKDFKSVDMIEIAKEITDYKSRSETFLERCMNFSKLKSKKIQRTHYDDFSTAAIQFDPV